MALRVTVLCAACSAAAAYVLPGAATAPRRGGVHVVRMEEGVESLPTMMPGQKSWMPKAEDTAMANKKWYVVDADGLRLGRMSSEIAKLLLGKHKPEFTQGADVGDCVVVINAEKVIVTGKKASQKFYRRHSGRPGGLTSELFQDLQVRIPERIVEKAIKGMLPKNAYGRELFRHLKVYKGNLHPHEAQQPEPLIFGGLTSEPDSQVLDLADPDAVCA
jgi:large subunit ribosomal protein L13